MPNIVGYGNTQVPTNAMLGGLAYQDPAHANLTEVEIENIAPIKAKVSSTVPREVFVYDTRKDSDGGAWRKKATTQSWYHESLGTQYRGHRKGFPAVAIMVAYTNSLTIYDGDDPNCSMWMHFNDNTSASAFNQAHMLASGSDGSNSYSGMRFKMLNGILAIGAQSAYRDGLTVIDFINDKSIKYMNDGKRWGRHNIADRNETGCYPVDMGPTTAGDEIPSNKVCDVDMKVMPDAPIDSGSGLPKPTIALATINGGCIIVPNNNTGGSIVDIKSSESSIVYRCRLLDSHKVMDNGSNLTKHKKYGHRVMFSADYDDYGPYVFMYQDSDISYSRTDPGGNANCEEVYKSIPSNVTSNVDLYWSTHISGSRRGPIDAYGDYRFFGTAKGINIVSAITSTQSMGGAHRGMIAYATKSYATGYLMGDCQFAMGQDVVTSSPPTSSVTRTSSELVTNGNFTTNTNGWGYASNGSSTSGNNNTASVESSALKLVRGSDSSNVDRYRQTITLVSGEKYIFSLRKVSGSIVVNCTGGMSSIGQITNPGSNDIYYEFTASSTSAMIELWALNMNSTAKFDEISVQLKGLDDRSYRGTGFKQIGTVTEANIGNNSDIRYIDFSNTNSFMYQTIRDTDHFSFLDHSNTEYTISCWAMRDVSSGWSPIVSKDYWNGGQQWFVGAITNMCVGGGEIGSTTIEADKLYHFVWTRDGTTTYCYLNGELDGTSTTSAAGKAGYGMVVGARWANGYGGEVPTSSSQCTDNGDWKKIALLKISNKMVSEAQVKELYNAERQIVADEAKATLYGSSDTINAIDYDESTGLLHVATTSGRSDFRGLRRINNTTRATGASANGTISASGGIIVEG